MGNNKTLAQAMLDNVLSRAISPVLRPIGFRKSAANYHRRHGSTIQVVNVQSGQYSQWHWKEFFINVGIAFDEICQLTNTIVLEKPKHYQCQDRGTSSRLETLIESAPSSWTVSEDVSLDLVATKLAKCIQELAKELQCIDSVAAYRDHHWFDLCRPKPVNAQCLFLLGDLEGAWKEILDLSKAFQDRKNANRPQWWKEQLHLTGLDKHYREH